MTRIWKITFGILVLAIVYSIGLGFVQITVAQTAQQEALSQKETADHEKAISDTLAAKYVATSREIENLKLKCPKLLP